MPYPNTLFNSGVNNGYPSGIKADYDKIIAKQEELNTFIEQLGNFEENLIKENLTFYKPPEIILPEIMVAYNIGLGSKNEYSLKDYNNDNTPVTKHSAINIAVVITKQLEIINKINDINKTTSIYFANVKMDLYIYFAFCTLYNEKLDPLYDIIMKGIDNLNIYLVGLTSFIANTKITLDENVKLLKSKTPPNRS
jgi:hypothetical protein